MGAFNKMKDKGLIKKMYRELVMKLHPDIGGDEELFKEIDNVFRADIYRFAKMYEKLTGKTSGLFSDQFKEYEGKNFGSIKEGKGNRGYPLNQLGRTKYPNTVQGIVDGWADVIIEKVDRVKWIENIVVDKIIVKVYINWIKSVKGKEYEQDAFLEGKFFDYDSYTDAVMEAIEGSIRELG